MPQKQPMVLIVFVLFVSFALAQEQSGETLDLQTLHPQSRIGIGDSLQVIYYDQQKLDDPGKRLKMIVEEDGTIYLPLLGDIVAVSKTTDELEKDLLEKLRKFIVQPQVQVQLLAEKANRVALLGSFTMQGLYPLMPGETLIQFVARHGGVTADADIANITVMREPGEIILVNLTSYFQFGDTSQDIDLQTQDRIFIPVKPVPWFEKAARVLQVVTFVLQITTFAIVLAK